LKKKKEHGLIFNTLTNPPPHFTLPLSLSTSTWDMVAGSGDRVTGRGCFLLGKFGDLAKGYSQ